ncbi:hypothetical protein [Yeosuana marina]|uniref:hypothetical protein n=1 Tax=Yeosuana marina TaxID=1565536 RepID=UPI0030ECF9DB|tara:strand:+ start:875 stop:1510 length:636 start_codon:yes stop_codon:yes gene_type:complete
MDISKEIEEVLLKHQGLVYHLESNSLSGELFLPHGDSYDLIIKLEPYPKFFPWVYEVGGRIPIKMDRHIYTDTGSCCFTTAAKSQILLKTKITSLIKFIDEIVVRYFENNSYYEINRTYYYDEYDHGSRGVVQSYQDILEISDTKSIGRLMLQRLQNKKLTIRDLCYCNSGQSLKKCSYGSHCYNYRLFRMIDKDVLYNDLKHFKNVLKIK